MKKEKWSTLDELRFLQNIGNHSSIVRKSKKELLENYISSPRINWGNINKKEVLTFARKELDLIESRCIQSNNLKVEGGEDDQI